ncbi:hypothetical protein KPH14_011946 [Odynerus spinipes]|uniref:Uncharacterized protein n=1 Tax=Odynerus spinipes TaxID=1348599 RepID=A0AAD9RCW2_9HYME|nr:hypothetical protein KPH14_011946 [Odynerus spinipes]
MVMIRQGQGPKDYWQVAGERRDSSRSLSFVHLLVDVPVDGDDDYDDDADDRFLLPVAARAAGIDETENVVVVLVGIDVDVDAERLDDGAAADGAPDNGAPDAGDGEACGGSAVLAGRGAWPPPPPVSSASLPLT